MTGQTDAQQDGTPLKRLAAVLAAPLNIQNVLQAVADEARHATRATRAAVALLSEDKTQLVFQAVSGPESEVIQGQRLQVAVSMMQDAIETNPDTPHLLPGDTLIGLPGVNSAAFMSMQADGKVIGAVAVLDKEGGISFDTQDLDTLAVLASTGAIAVHWAEAEAKRRSCDHHLRTLIDAASRVAGSFDVTHVTQTLVDMVIENMEHLAVAVFLPVEEARRLFISASAGLEADQLEVSLEVDDPLLTGIQAPTIVPQESLAAAASTIFPGIPVQSLLLVPINSPRYDDETRLVGLLAIAASRQKVYTPSDIELLATLSTHLSAALETAQLLDNLRLAERRTTDIMELTVALNDKLDIDQVLHQTAAFITRTLNVRKCALFLLDSDGHTLRFAHGAGVDTRAFLRYRPLLDQGILGQVLSQQEYAAPLDVRTDPICQACPLPDPDVVSVLCLPLAIGEKQLGVLAAMSDQRREFTIQEAEQAYIAANHAAIALSNSQRYIAETQKSEELKGYFRRVAKAAASSVPSRDTPRLIVNTVREVLNADRCVYHIQEDETVRLAAVSPTPAASSHRRAATAVGWALRTGRTLFTANAMNDRRFDDDDAVHQDAMASVLCVPVNEGNVRGVITLYRSALKGFRRSDSELVSTIVELVSSPAQV